MPRDDYTIVTSPPTNKTMRGADWKSLQSSGELHSTKWTAQPRDNQLHSSPSPNDGIVLCVRARKRKRAQNRRRLGSHDRAVTAEVFGRRHIKPMQNAHALSVQIRCELGFSACFTQQEV